MASKKNESKTKLKKDASQTSGSQSIMDMFRRQKAMNQVCQELSSKESSTGTVKSDYFKKKVSTKKPVQRSRRLSLKDKRKSDESHEPIVIDLSDADDASENQDKCEQIMAGVEAVPQDDEIGDRGDGDANSKEKDRRLSLRKRKGSDSVLPQTKRQKSSGKKSESVRTKLNNGCDITELKKEDSICDKTCDRKDTVDAADSHKDLPAACASNGDHVTVKDLNKESTDVSVSAYNCPEQSGNSLEDTDNLVGEEQSSKAELESLKQENISVAENGSASVENDEKPAAGPSVENGDQQEDVVEEMEEYRVPYYLENFHLVMSTVLEDEFCSHLFDEEDMATVDTFRKLSDSGQKLYIRLFQRKHKWLRQAKISYPQIGEDLSEVLQELCSCHLMDDESCLTDLEQVLEVLAVPDLRSLAKSLRLTQGANQKDVIAAVMKHAKGQHLSAFFKQPQGGTASVILKRAKSLLGPCYRLTRTPRAVFIRLMMLFSLHQTNGDEEEGAGGHQQLFQILMANIGQIKYPDYEILKKRPVFSSREDLLRFECSIQTEIDMMTAMEKHHFEEALQISDSAKQIYEELWKNEDYINHAKSLPHHLRSFTACSVYIRVMSYGVEALQRQRRYPEAVALLEEMLSQDVFQLSYHGRWYERLALNLDQHLKQSQKALDKIHTALQDPYVRTGHRLALFQRAQRLCQAPAHKKLHQHWTKFENDPMAVVQEPIKVTIQCRQVSQAGIGALGVCRFITEESLRDGNLETTFFRSVEDVVLAHYKDHGYPKGVHGEGRTYLFLFNLFFWDVIFMEGIPDVFLNAYQTYPLDARTQDFYENRKDAFDKRLEEIKSMSTEALLQHVSDMWEKYEGVSCSGCNWELFDGLEHCQGLLQCLGANHLAGILERMMKDLRNTTGGGPDLIVWNCDTGQVKISEVKGPGDRLSTKQILWLDYLVKLGLDAEVCHVEAIGVKKLR